MAIFYTNSSSFNDLKVSGSALISASRGTVLQLKSSGSTIFSISGSAGPILTVTDSEANKTLFSIASGSTTIVNVDGDKKVLISGSNVITGSLFVSGTVNFTGLSSDTQSWQHILGINTSSGYVVARPISNLPPAAYYGSYYSATQQVSTWPATASIAFSGIVTSGQGLSYNAENAVTAVAGNAFTVTNSGWYDTILVVNVVNSAPTNETNIIIIPEYSTNGGSTYSPISVYTKYLHTITNTYTPVTVNLRMAMDSTYRYRFSWYATTDKIQLGSTTTVNDGVPSALLHMQYIKTF